MMSTSAGVISLFANRRYRRVRQLKTRRSRRREHQHQVATIMPVGRRRPTDGRRVRADPYVAGRLEIKRTLPRIPAVNPAR